MNTTIRTLSVLGFLGLASVGAEAAVTARCDLLDNGNRWKITASNNGNLAQTCNFACDYRNADGTTRPVSCNASIAANATDREACSNAPGNRMTAAIGSARVTNCR